MEEQGLTAKDAARYSVDRQQDTVAVAGADKAMSIPYGVAIEGGSSGVWGCHRAHAAAGGASAIGFPSVGSIPLCSPVGVECWTVLMGAVLWRKKCGRLRK
jgi:hypothetical protein